MKCITGPNSSSSLSLTMRDKYSMARVNSCSLTSSSSELLRKIRSLSSASLASFCFAASPVETSSRCILLLVCLALFGVCLVSVPNDALKKAGSPLLGSARCGTGSPYKWVDRRESSARAGSLVDWLSIQVGGPARKFGAQVRRDVELVDWLSIQVGGPALRFSGGRSKWTGSPYK